MISKHQSGTALTEFIVVMVVLAPLMFGIPMIGKMIDLKQAAVQASRHSAWETTVQSGAVVPDLDTLYFGDASAPIGADSDQPNSLWGAAVPAGTAEDGSGGSAEPAAPLSGYMADTAVVVNGGSVSETVNVYAGNESAESVYGPTVGKGPAFHIGRAVHAMGIISEATGSDWDAMQTDGLIRGIANVTMEGNGWFGPKTFTQNTVIMNDSWSVGGAVAARDRLRALVPASGLTIVSKVIGAIGYAPGLTELGEFRKDDGRAVFGYVDMEPLPLSETEELRPLKAYEEDE